MKKKPRTNSSGTRSTGRPRQSVAIQQKICTPVGIAIIMLAAVKNPLPSSRQRRGEHVVHPHAERDERRSR